MTDVRQTLIQDTMYKVTEAENNLALEALFVHTGEVFCRDSLHLIQGRMTLQVRGNVKHLFLDDKEILEIHPLTYDMDGMIMNTKFNYKVCPK